MEGLKESLGMKITAQGLTPPPHSSFRRSVLMRTDLRPTAQQTRDSLWNRFNKVDLSFRRLKGRPDVRQLGVMVQRPNAALNYTSVSYSP
ncbi:unnamed protein product [Arctogadus glacialis]